MESLGFKYQPQGSHHSDSTVGLFWRRVAEVKRGCLANEGKLLFTVELYDRLRYTKLNDENRFAFDADITGEYVKDLWVKLRVYSVRPEDFFEKHKDIEAALLRAWEALA
jgi:hypothetical protein